MRQHDEDRAGHLEILDHHLVTTKDLEETTDHPPPRADTSRIHLLGTDQVQMDSLATNHRTGTILQQVLVLQDKPVASRQIVTIHPPVRLMYQGPLASHQTLTIHPQALLMYQGLLPSHQTLTVLHHPVQLLEEHLAALLPTCGRTISQVMPQDPAISHQIRTTVLLILLLAQCQVTNPLITTVDPFPPIPIHPVLDLTRVITVLHRRAAKVAVFLASVLPHTIHTSLTVHHLHLPLPLLLALFHRHH